MEQQNQQFVRRPSAKEEVIADAINGIRKRIIQIQLECEFGMTFLEENPNTGTEEANAQLMENIEYMRKEEVALIAKLNFYKGKRDGMKAKRKEAGVKRAMKDYDSFPETIASADLIEETEKM